MADTVREQIIQAFATKLATVTVANGYHYDVGNSVERAVPAKTKDQVPALVLWDTNDSVAEIQNYSGGHIALPLLVNAFIAVDPLVNNSVAANRLLGDLIKAMTSGDTTLGGLADSTRYTESQMEYPQPGEQTIGVNVVFNLMFNFAKGDPFTTQP